MLALRQYARALVLVSIALCFAQGVRAAGLESLIMPGPVSQAHARIEDNCSACHDRSDRARQTTLCLDCHKEIAADLRTRARLHGRMQQATNSECRGCHSEHHGRATDITEFNPAG